MTIVIEDTQIEQLINKIASVDGISATEVLCKSLDALIRRRAIIANRATFAENLAKLAREIDEIRASSPPDNRSDDEILGYNEYGGWD
jgi:hypothetical protein